MHRVMITLVDNVKLGVVYAAGRAYGQIFKEGQCTFELVAKRWYSPLLGYATWFHGTDDFPTLQVIWPEPVRESKKSSTVKSSTGLLQPMLCHTNIDRAKMRSILDAINKASHTHSARQEHGTLVPETGDGKTPRRNHDFKPEEWPFDVSEHTKVYTTIDIATKKHAILGIVHEDDGTWQILSGGEIIGSEVRAACLGCVFDFDRSVGELADLPRGWEAWRDEPNKPWRRSRFVEGAE